MNYSTGDFARAALSRLKKTSASYRDFDLGRLFAWALLLITCFIAYSYVIATPTSSSTLRTITLTQIPAYDNPSAAFEIATRSNTPHPDSYEKRNPHDKVWVYVQIPKSYKNKIDVVEIPILRFKEAESSRIWKISHRSDGTPEFTLADTRRTIDPGFSKSGFSIAIDDHSSIDGILINTLSFMPSAPTALGWELSEYKRTKADFDRQGGALYGCILALACFSLLVSLINKEKTFFIFGGLLLTSLRIGAVNAGWDRHWLGLNISDDTYLTFLRVSIAAYGFFNLAIYRDIQKSSQQHSRLDSTFIALQFGFACFAASAPFFDHVSFLKYFWIYAIVALSLLTAQLSFLLLFNKNAKTGWFGLSWVVMLVGMGAEIAAQSGVLAPPAWLNSQLAAAISALVLGLTLTDRLNAERDSRIAAQTKSLIYLRDFERNFNLTPAGLFSLDLHGNIILRNPAFSELFLLQGDSSSQPQNIDTLLGPNGFARLFESASSTGDPIEFHIENNSVGSRWFVARVSMNGDSVEGSLQDITQKKKAELQLKNLVDHDHLTGLLNRRGLENAVQAAVVEVAHGINCAIAYVDIDRFKLLNDLHGFGTGDVLLQQVGRRIQTVARGRDTVARVADSFVVVLHDCSDHSAASPMERIREAICAEPFEVEGKELNITVSVGVVSIDPSASYVDLMAAAGRACSEAKARGRNCVVRLSDQDSTLRSHLEELKVVADLQQRLPTDRYFLEFQPIVALHSPGSSLNYEVLIRMRGEDGGVIPPARFIGAAERHGMMSQIDRWVLRTTLEWLDAHPEHRDRLSFATINLSGASLNDKRFVDDAFALIAEHPQSTAKLCFEITESVALHDIGSTRRFADRVRLRGSKLALDDFGAGYTSFNYLKEIPADFIKIDGSFVKDINRNPANYSITRTIVELTHELGMRSIAEWAETPDTVASLLELGVDFAQGFGLVRPCSPDIVAATASCGALVRDPHVIALLDEASARPVIIPKRRLARGLPR